MASKRAASEILRTARPAVAASWMAMLVEATLGVDGGTVRAEVKAKDGEVADGEEYRLVVQTYDGPLSARASRPVGSTQRAVTGAELKTGVRVNLLELRDVVSDAKGHVVAWIESGKADLEFDGRRARPTPGSVMGQALRSSGTVQISLNRKIAA
jgi:hypothetical protein